MLSDIYPGPECPPGEAEGKSGIFPVDFILETIIRAGLDWFRNDSEAPNTVFGHLTAPYLFKYGQNKIDEVSEFIKSTEIRVVQHFSLIDQNYPTFSIQLLDGSEESSRAAMGDFKGQIDEIDDMNNVLGRTEIGYAPITDNIHIGVHATNTPDLVKYLYYLLIYILYAFKPQLEERGLHLSTFRATDLSRLNDYLPNNMYSRYVNFTTFTVAPFRLGKVPILEEILGANIVEEIDDCGISITGEEG